MDGKGNTSADKPPKLDCSTGTQHRRRAGWMTKESLKKEMMGAILQPKQRAIGDVIVEKPESVDGAVCS